MTETTQRRRLVAAPRSRGALSGFGLVVLGVWGAIIAFIGPYWDYAYTPNSTWTWTAARGLLEVLPGCVTILAGLVILFTASRLMAAVSAMVGIVAGVWFVVGPLLAPIWSTNYLGTPIGDSTDVAVEQIGIFYGLGAAIIMLAAFALGRFLLPAARDVSYPHDRDHSHDRDAAAQPYSAAPEAAPNQTAPPAGSVAAPPTQPGEGTGARTSSED